MKTIEPKNNPFKPWYLVIAFCIAAFILHSVVRFPGCEYVVVKQEKAKKVVIQDVKPEFHMRLVPFGDFDNYKIVFTNDNWVVEDEIYDCFDLSPVMGEEWVVRQVWLGDKQEAIHFAKTLDTYEKCIAHNDRMKLREKKLKKRYKDNPMAKPKPEKKPDITPINIH